MVPCGSLRAVRIRVVKGIGFAFFILSEAANALPDETLPVSIEWTGPSDCAEAKAAETYIRRMLSGTSHAASPNSDVHVVVQLATDGKWDVSIETMTSGIVGERSLRVDSCEEARRAVALLVALMIDPNAQPRALDQPSSTENQEANPAPERPSPPAPPVAVATQKPVLVQYATELNRVRPRWFAGATAVADWGTLPTSSLGAELRASVTQYIWSLGLGGTAWIPSRGSSRELPEAGGKFTLLESRAYGCVGASSRVRIQGQFCVGPSLLHMHATGYGVSEPGSASTTWLAAAAEGAALIPLTHEFGWRIALEALAPMARPTFAIRDVGTIYRPKALAFRGSIGFEVLFW